MQRERRRDPYPLTWEIPVAVVVAAFLVLVVGVHLGRAVALAVSGEGWGWPTRADLFVMLPRVLEGDAHAGLSGGQGAATGVVLLRACIAVVEIVLLVACAALLRAGLVRWGPRRVQGMATRTDAQHLLGVSRLRATRAIIRPDLYRDQR